MRLANDAVKTLSAKTRSEAVHTALQEAVATRRFIDLILKHGGKLKFKAHGKH
jgi:Arc/MetJ family transcription regulator